MKLMRERLKEFKVPDQVIKNLRDDIIAIFAAPERNKLGATVMTQAASLAADEAKRSGKQRHTDAKPERL